MEQLRPTVMNELVSTARHHRQMALQLRHAIGDRPVIIFNARFDTRIETDCRRT